MNRILIADDEALEREGLEFILNKYLPGQYKIFHAKNGREAIEQAEENQPDIVLMDIKMPGIQGLDALKRIREMNPKTKMVVITAYDYFSYAKEAVPIGIKEYILKPAKREQVVSLLQRLTKELDEEKEKTRESLKMQEKLTELMPLVESEMAMMIMVDQVQELNLVRLAELSQFQIETGYCLVLALPINSLNKDKRKLYEAAKNFMKTNVSCVAGPMIGNQIVFFPAVDRTKQGYSLRIDAIELAQKLSDYMQDRFRLEVSIGIGSIQTKLEGLRQSYQEAIHALGEKNININIRHYEDILMNPSWDGFTFEEERRLLDGFKSMDINEIISSFRQMFDRLKQDSDSDLKSCRDAVVGLLAIISRYFRQFGIHLEEGTIVAADFQELQEIAEKRLQMMIHTILQHKGNKAMDVIERARKFIQEHYREDLSMEQTAEHVNLSPYYFSKIFKSENGKTFTDYLTDIRIQKAKELMAEMTISLKEVCYEVGYKDPNYFSRVFKRVTGMTPTDYRQQLSTFL
ncbi:response regulator [Mesobacillus subterraneus]|uniref:Response regulator n=1 Tax=Mesobacillus subterraneus TaxID=285983 RepID=A0A0D6Z9G5_9BACI|nr:response regulator [Mesobacillus subterraneus]KIY22192.1 hypothetical protein UB32_09800 [Mesobacillus subterraneus]